MKAKLIHVSHFFDGSVESCFGSLDRDDPPIFLVLKNPLGGEGLSHRRTDDRTQREPDYEKEMIDAA
ncbi:hypothetical protein [Sphingobium sp.]|uniref:hypothetical protein n=1 Tax=Sphingobium sp. TaxID=1912891 RepID=UPI0035C6905A